MTHLPTFAIQHITDSDYLRNSISNNNADSAVVASIIVFTLLFTLIVVAVTYIVTAIFLGKIFKKAGVESWIAWVPFYNYWKLLELGGQQGYWAVLSILPVVSYVSVVFMCIAMYHIGKKFGKDGTFVLLAIFLPIVWIIWLAVDKSKWNDKGSTAPSLHKAS